MFYPWLKCRYDPWNKKLAGPDLCRCRVAGRQPVRFSTLHPVIRDAGPHEGPPADTNAARWHSIKVTPRAGLPKVHFYDKLNPVWWAENSDEPVPPKWYKPEDRHRVMKWHFRNPFHNFGNYVIGVADKEFVRSGKYVDRNSRPPGGWNLRWPGANWFCFRSFPAGGAVLTSTSAGANAAILESSSMFPILPATPPIRPANPNRKLRHPSLHFGVTGRCELWLNTARENRWHRSRLSRSCLWLRIAREFPRRDNLLSLD